MTIGVTPADILTFWREAGPDQWFADDPAFDLAVRSRFFATHGAAARGGLIDWEHSAAGALALVLLFDQFPRNMFRGDARAFATDAMARAVAERALARGYDQATDSTMRPFFYLPFMHSEALVDQDRSRRSVTRTNCATPENIARSSGGSGGSRAAIARSAARRHGSSGHS